MHSTVIVCVFDRQYQTQRVRFYSSPSNITAIKRQTRVTTQILRPVNSPTLIVRLLLCIQMSNTIVVAYTESLTGLNYDVKKRSWIPDKVGQPKFIVLNQQNTEKV